MKTIVIGAGASGIVAAIAAANAGSSVTVIEHNKQVGKKILITGNGRCNITNEAMDENKFYGDSSFIKKVLEAYSTDDIRSFFENIGICTVSKKGYIYPSSMQAQTVCEFLREYAMELGVKIKTNNTINSIQQINGKYVVDIGIPLECDNLILATGGKSYEVTGSDGSGYELAMKFGHTITKLSPALTALVIKKDILYTITKLSPALTALVIKKDILTKSSGVRVKGTVSKGNYKHTGEIQITDYGVSGIPVFNISRTLETNDNLEIDFAPDFSTNELREIILKFSKIYKDLATEKILKGLYNEKLASVLAEKSGLKKIKAKDLSTENIESLINTIKNYNVIIDKKRGFDYAQVTAGGVDTSEINAETMGSKLSPNLYIVGEMLDVDGICGGYNLHFAWCTGLIAGGNCN